MSSTPTPPRLATPAQYLKGVGPERAVLFQRLGLNTAADILFHFPRDYQDLSQVRRIAELEDRIPVSIKGVVEDIEQRTTSTGTHMVGALIQDGTGVLRAVWFNQPFIRKRLRHNAKILVSGEPKRTGLMWEMVHPHILAIESEAILPSGSPAGEILPVYPLTEGLKQSQLRRVVAHVLDEFTNDVVEVLPASFREAHDLCGVARALSQIHFPTSQASLSSARRRFAFQELLVMQLGLAIRRRQFETLYRAPVIAVTAKIDARVRRVLGVTLTPGQESAIADICRDLSRPLPMNRLLQGDVGSGKTFVALYAMLATVAQGYQAVLMTPTDVLARQHFRTLQRVLSQSRARLALWTGSLSARDREKLQQQVAAGDIDMLVGTQAIIHASQDWQKLGLVVIDEQHKFGVQQRAQLRQAGVAPHYLVMTATPIPRSVAMTAYGDLDVSSMRDAPVGRQRVRTYVVTDELRARWWDFFRQQLRQGRQGFVVTPRLQVSETEEIVSLQEAFEAMCNGELEAFRLDLIHGRMATAEKEVAMERFYRGDTQVLVATSVIEVGIDVPNAAVMTIENAERFGLAQLHQLRGRVGRGAYRGYVGIFASAESEQGYERLESFAATSDGFEIAELDFQLRGPGDLLGTRQHGLPPLRAADLRRDAELLQDAQRVARELVHTEDIKSPPFARLLQQVVKRYGATYQLGDVG